MPKYLVRMNYVISYGTEFVIEADDGEMVDDVLHSMDSDVLEKTLPWICNNYESPIIEHLQEVDSGDNKVLINNHPIFMENFNKTKKEIYDS